MCRFAVHASVAHMRFPEPSPWRPKTTNKGFEGLEGHEPTARPCPPGAVWPHVPCPQFVHRHDHSGDVCTRSQFKSLRGRASPLRARRRRMLGDNCRHASRSSPAAATARCARAVRLQCACSAPSREHLVHRTLARQIARAQLPSRTVCGK